VALLCLRRQLKKVRQGLGITEIISLHGDVIHREAVQYFSHLRDCGNGLSVRSLRIWEITTNIQYLHDYILYVV
jgi:hypothetical protein